MIGRAAPFIEWQEQSESQISKHIKARKARVIASPDIMHNLRHHEQILKDYEPLIIGEEVWESEVHEQPYIELDVEGSKLLPESLWVIDLSHVVAPPHQEQQLHVEDHKQDDVGECRQDVEEVPVRWWGHDVFDVDDGQIEVFNVADGHGREWELVAEVRVRTIDIFQQHVGAHNLGNDYRTQVKRIPNCRYNLIVIGQGSRKWEIGPLHLDSDFNLFGILGGKLAHFDGVFEGADVLWSRVDCIHLSIYLSFQNLVISASVALLVHWPGLDILGRVMSILTAFLSW